MIGESLTEELKSAGVNLISNCGVRDHVTGSDIIITSLLQVKNITKEGETMTVQLCGDNSLTGVDCVLYAIGRTPNTSDLGLDIAVCVNISNNNLPPLSLGSESQCDWSYCS